MRPPYSPTRTTEQPAIFGPRILAQPFAGLKVVQTKSSFERAPDIAYTPLRMFHPTATLEAQAQRPAVGLADTACLRLQAVQLTAMKPEWHDVQHGGVVRRGVSTDPYICQHPTIDTMRFERVG